MGNIHKIAIYGSRRQQPHGEQLRRLIINLTLSEIGIAIHEKLYDHLTRELGLTLPGVKKVSTCPADVDLAISIGGDGTFLRTVAWLENVEVPLLGINTGHLGYLTAITLDEALSEPEKIINLDFRVEKLSMLKVEAPGLKNNHALNEVVVAKEDSASMITTTAKMNGGLLANYKADGLIVATPTGSTAYNLSVGGPIVEPSAPVWVISPIAAHSLTLRPLIVDDNSILELTVSGRGHRFRLVLDGRATSLPMGTSILINRSEHRVTVLQCHDRSFAKIIGEKLMFNG